VDYACERGIPHSRFLGRNDGPEWMPEDRAVVAVWQTEQAQKCPTCGTFDWEQEEDPEAWQAGIHWCVFCKQVEELKVQTAQTALHPEGYKLRLYRGGPDGD
jgi:hypothetical protein